MAITENLPTTTNNNNNNHRIPTETALSHTETDNPSHIASAYRTACEQDGTLPPPPSGLTTNDQSFYYYLLPAKWMDDFLKYASSSETTDDDDDVAGGQQQHPHPSSPTTPHPGASSSYDEKKENTTTATLLLPPPTTSPPSKITNAPFLSNTLELEELKPGLCHGRDYALVGPAAWKMLVSRYGCDMEIARPVVMVGEGTTNATRAVEVYDRTKGRRVEGGKKSGPALVTLPLGGRWNLPQLSRWEESGKEMVYEGGDDSGDDMQSSPSTHATSQFPSQEETNNTSIAPSASPTHIIPPIHSPSPPYNRQLALVSLTPQATKELEPVRKKTRKMGRCGLGNLGNTCFMNSTLQCLAHTDFLRDYFLTSQYHSDLNRDNPLGTGGELATEFAKLMQQMWNPTPSSDSINEGVVYPRNFKYTLGHHAEQFIGYDQHDSQELATYLLDALHEDTNRVTKKPYVEKPEQTETESDIDAAEKAWSLHLKREDSKVLEGFMGQVKSRVKCPNEKCGRVSTTFDPFMYLSVPIPGATDRTLTVTFVPLNPEETSRKLNITMSKTSTVASLQGKIAEMVPDLDKDDLAVVDVWSDEIYTFFAPTEDISRIRDSDQTYVFQLTSLASIHSQGEEDGDGDGAADMAIVESDEYDELELEEGLDPAMLMRLNRNDEWMNSMENYVRNFTTLKTMWNPKRTNHEERMQFLQKLQTFLQKLSKCPEAQPASSETDSSSLNLSEVSSQHQIFRNVNNLQDLLILSHCAKKFYDYSLQLRQQSRQKLKDGVLIQILFKKDCHPRVSSMEKTFAAPLVLRVGPNVTVYALRKLLGERLRRVLSSEAPLKVHKVDDTLDAEMEEVPSTPSSPASPTATTETQNMMPSKTLEQEYVYPMNSARETLLLRRIPMTYQRKNTYNYQGTHRQLGSLSKNTTSQQLALSSESSENESVAELVGNQGSINLHWPSSLVEDIFNVSSWNDVSLPPPASHKTSTTQPPLSVITCIEKYCQMEQLEESEMWYCNKCKDHVRAWKQFHLYRTPPILIVHLKRFHYSSSTHRRDKIDAFIDFPLKGLDLRGKVLNWNDGEEPIYDCYAVSNHYGGLGGGHYTAYAKNNGEWCHFDDCRVTEGVDESDVISPAAYVLYYKRRGQDDNDWGRGGSVGDSIDGEEMFDEEDDEEEEDGDEEDEYAGEVESIGEYEFKNDDDEDEATGEGDGEVEDISLDDKDDKMIS